MAAATPALAAPALAQSQPQIKWRMTSSFPKTLDILHGTAEFIARNVAELTDGKFQIQVFAAGEIVGGLQALDAIQNQTVECAYTTGFYYIGKDPVWCFSTGLPFGLNSRQQMAWVMLHAEEVLGDFYRSQNAVLLPAGHTAAQMGGWFRREINSLDDMRGLKFRVGGLAGEILSRVGVVPQQIAAGDIYPALERGTIDAAEWIGPYDDERLGFVKVAPYYYYPGWWEGASMHSLMINPQKWEELPPSYKAALKTTCWNAAARALSLFDAGNPGALRRLVAAGAQIKAFPREVLDASRKAADEVYAGICSKNPTFKKAYDHYTAFREEEYLWWQVAELGYDAMMIRQRRR